MALNLDALGRKFGPLTFNYTWKDVILYALGVGSGFGELDYVYENKLKVIPSFAVTTVYGAIAEAAVTANVDLSGLLHGEQDTIFYRPLPIEGRLTTELTLTDIFDKGADKGAVVVAVGDTFHENGQKLYTNIIKLFCRKDGGFGGHPGPPEEINIPDRPPDFEERAEPSPDQPLIYRLSGDYFALHIDPDFARASGFEMPIMHGLCTHGYACRAVIKHLFAGQPERMTRFRLRFSKTLYPGIPIVTQIWKVDQGSAYFRVINADNGDPVIDRGVVEWLSSEEMERRDRLGGINFDGQVAVVTGAGAGLGRLYALDLARKGARVLVNDLGAARDGTGASTSAADRVVEEIKALGGEAAANHDSVATPEGGRGIVQAALQSFGRLDILINNAGILRDKTLAKMEPENWEAVLDVHLRGAYNVTRPALEAMRAQKYGRIILTTSAAGLYGNFGQTNYSAAKMGLVGFMSALKEEGIKYNIKVNTVAPVATTRLTEDILPPEMQEKLKPEFISPLVLYLCSEQCPVSGRIYNAGPGYYNRAAVVTGPGAVVGDGVDPPRPEEVAAAMDRIKVLDQWSECSNATASFTPMLEALQPGKMGDQSAAVDELTVSGVFENMTQAFQPDQAAGLDLVFLFDITGAKGGQWAVAVKDGACQVTKGGYSSPTTTLSISDDDFLKMMSGQISPMSAFTSGKLKISGDIMKSQLIEKLFRIY